MLTYCSYRFFMCFFLPPQCSSASLRTSCARLFVFRFSYSFLPFLFFFLEASCKFVPNSLLGELRAFGVVDKTSLFFEALSQRSDHAPPWVVGISFLLLFFFFVDRESCGCNVISVLSFHPFEYFALCFEPQHVYPTTFLSVSVCGTGGGARSAQGRR